VPRVQITKFGMPSSRAPFKICRAVWLPIVPILKEEVFT
jgi:hypothetical protein